MKVLNVYYVTKPGKRDAFYEALFATEAPQKSRAEEGNIKYDYYFSTENEDEIILVEHWKDEEAFKIHTEQEHFKALQGLKAEYLVDSSVQMFEIK